MPAGIAWAADRPEAEEGHIRVGEEGSYSVSNQYSGLASLNGRHTKPRGEAAGTTW